jgi:hypothetical protein
MATIIVSVCQVLILQTPDEANSAPDVVHPGFLSYRKMKSRKKMVVSDPWRCRLNNVGLYLAWLDNNLLFIVQYNVVQDYR